MLRDYLTPGLRVVFVGTSVGDLSASRQHYYSHPSNRFWELLEETGLTSGAGLTPVRDREVLEHRLGLTDIVKGRSASSDALLEDEDYDVVGFLARIDRYEPSVVAFNGKEATKRVAKHLGRRVVDVGPAPWPVGPASAYRLPSSSGANSRGGYEPKAAAWRAFGAWVQAAG